LETYNIKRNIAKTIVSNTHSESWDRSVCSIDTETFGEQSVAYKVLKHLSRANRDTIEINTIEDKKWVDLYKSLWCSNSPQNNEDEPGKTSLPSGRNR
jgi:hypothetical protein